MRTGTTCLGSGRADRTDAYITCTILISQLLTANCLPHAAINRFTSFTASIQILYEAVATPRRVAGLDDVTVLRIAAGHSHCLCIDDQGSCYSWGNGGYGRLGHKVGRENRDGEVERKWGLHGARMGHGA